jgi:hypothetical protein
LEPNIDRDIDFLIEALEEMIDARDDMWQEEKYHNHKQMLEISEKRYVPAKNKFKNFLTEIITTIANR